MCQGLYPYFYSINRKFPQRYKMCLFHLYSFTPSPPDCNSARHIGQPGKHWGNCTEGHQWPLSLQAPLAPSLDASPLKVRDTWALVWLLRNIRLTAIELAPFSFFNQPGLEDWGLEMTARGCNSLSAWVLKSDLSGALSLPISHQLCDHSQVTAEVSVLSLKWSFSINIPKATHKVKCDNVYIKHPAPG